MSAARPRCSLRAARGRIRYCGPVSLAAVTGWSTDTAFERIRRRREDRGRDPGVLPLEILRTLEGHAFPVGKEWIDGRLTVRDFLLAKAVDAAAYILVVARHFIAACPATGMVVDSEAGVFLPRPPQPATARRRVNLAFRIAGRMRARRAG